MDQKTIKLIVYVFKNIRCLATWKCWKIEIWRMARFSLFLITDLSEKLWGIRRSIFLKVHVIELKFNWNWFEADLKCFELDLILKRRESNGFGIEMKLNCIRIELFWIEVAIEIEFNWIDLQLMWFEMDWNWIELIWFWFELNRFEFELHWMELNLNVLNRIETELNLI